MPTIVSNSRQALRSVRLCNNGVRNRVDYDPFFLLFLSLLNGRRNRSIWSVKWIAAVNIRPHRYIHINVYVHVRGMNVKAQYIVVHFKLLGY